MRIKLDPFERQLILKYGYPSPDLQLQLKDLSNSERSESITFSEIDINFVTGDLSRSMNHGEVPRALIDEIDALCGRLEVYL